MEGTIGVGSWVKIYEILLLTCVFRQYSGIHSQFDAGAIAKVSDGYTIGSVVGCIKDVLTCKRNLQLRVQPLTHLELINALR